MYISSRPVSVICKLLFLALVLYGIYMSFVEPIVEEDLFPISYFSIQSNILVAMTTFYFIMIPRFTRFSAIVRGSVMLCILVTGLVFHIVLVPHYTEFFKEGLAFKDHLTHTIAPLGFVLDWLLFDQKGLMKFFDIKYWVIYPLLYWIITVSQGAFSGVYTYFFMDIGKIGFGAALAWLLALSVIFIIIGFVLIGIDNLLRKQVPTQ
jgi:hypothetical protein